VHEQLAVKMLAMEDIPAIVTQSNKFAILTILERHVVNRTTLILRIRILITGKHPK